MVAEFVVALQPELVIETGTAFGQTAEAIGHALAANGHGRLVTIETDSERVDFSRNRCGELPVTVLEMSSLDYTFDGPVDFAWFDSLIDLRIRSICGICRICPTGLSPGGTTRVPSMWSTGTSSGWSPLGLCRRRCICLLRVGCASFGSTVPGDRRIRGQPADPPVGRC